jgi:hypothetical protein
MTYYVKQIEKNSALAGRLDAFIADSAKPVEPTVSSA